MSRDKEKILAKRKRADELLSQGVRPWRVRDQIKEEFGSGISSEWLYQQSHKMSGTKPRKLKRRAQKEVVRKTETLDVRVVSQPARAVDTILTALLQAMRAEGVDSVMMRADGRATVYHVVSRELQVSPR